MRDYWLTKDLLQATGIGFIALSLVCLGVALWLPKRWWGKLLAVVAVGFVFSVPLREAKKEELRQEAAMDDYQARYVKAKALFDERCKTAGEKICKTVDGVEGILLLSIRQTDRPGISDNPLWPDAALPREAGGDDYIRYFLYDEYDGSAEGRRLPTGKRGYLSVPVTGDKKAISRGYQFVDVKQPDGSVARYRLKEQNKRDLVTELIVGKTSRYAVGFVNQLNSGDRAHWVAGTTITLTDTRVTK